MTFATLAFAHRGWHSHHIENTLGAMDAAYLAGCDGVEFDVQLTRDGIPVLFHDDDLLRLASRPERVCDLTWKELRAIRLRHENQSGLIPTLDDFLSRYGQKPFYLELKIPHIRQGDKAYCERLAMLCVDAVKLCKPHAQTFLASFHIPMMQWLRSTQPGLPLGIIYEDENDLEHVLKTESAGSHAQAWLHSLAAEIWKHRTANQKQLPDATAMWLWGLHSEADMNQALRAGLGGLVVDDVPTLMRLVGRN